MRCSLDTLQITVTEQITRLSIVISYKQSTGRYPSQLISGCRQMFTENSLLYPEFLLTLVSLLLICMLLTL